uniref:Uncharacterized protein n=1 Tax=Hucho hucho TaxID=62062 RepID=A0A4W5MH15_9TELE
ERSTCFYLSDTSELFFWEDPRKVGIEVSEADGTKYFHGPGTGTPVYLAHGRAKRRDFIKGGDTLFMLTMEDVSHLTVIQPVPPVTMVTTAMPTPALTSHVGMR